MTSGNALSAALSQAEIDDVAHLAKPGQPRQWAPHHPARHGAGDDDIDQVGPGHGHGAKAIQRQEDRSDEIDDGACCRHVGSFFDGQLACQDGHGNGAKRYEDEAQRQHLHHRYHLIFVKKMSPVPRTQKHQRCHRPRGRKQHAEGIAQHLGPELLLALDEGCYAKVAKYMGDGDEHRAHGKNADFLRRKQACQHDRQRKVGRRGQVAEEELQGDFLTNGGHVR